MKRWKKELNLFFIAMGFFTRIPMPAWVEIAPEYMNKASRYFGLVGLVVGSLSAATYALAVLWLPPSVAIIFAMIAGVVVTGGFHEDGLADTADGFGGGWTIADKLRIMKDSSLGSYGALTLMFALLLKWQLLSEIALFDSTMVILALIIGHGLSRVFSASFMFTEEYVRDAASSKSQSLAQDQSLNELFILLATAAVILLLVSIKLALILILSLFIVRALLIRLFRRQIGGYTGDSLGAAQQLAEVVCYMMLLVFKFSL